jgi:transcriptional regulator with GAF, ATPase, and Fis domain
MRAQKAGWKIAVNASPFDSVQARRITMAILDLIGSSAKFRALLDNIDMVAPVDSAVLIQGETGTGKEVIARAIHEASPRRRNRFVALNCAAIPVLC